MSDRFISVPYDRQRGGTFTTTGLSLGFRTYITQKCMRLGLPSLKARVRSEGFGALNANLKSSDAASCRRFDVASPHWPWKIELATGGVKATG
jgi:hypothetical protein